MGRMHGGASRVGAPWRGSERARIGATVDQPVLAGDKTCVLTAQKRTGAAELIGPAQASRGNPLFGLGAHLVEADLPRVGLSGHRFRNAVRTNLAAGY
jgi:hypothetical protein